MFRLNLLGHVHLTRDGDVVPVSRKALALIAYLTLEATPHHRDHLASLLWDNAGALVNLRVELTRLRQLGIDLFPARQAMLHLRLPTDLDAWEAGGPLLTAETVGPWMAQLHDTPLSGVDDLGSGAFRTWLDHQRGRITGSIEQQCTQTAARLIRHGHVNAAAAIHTQAAALGLHLGSAAAIPERRSPAPARRDDWPAQTAALTDLLGHARQEPQCVLVWGQRGSARTLIAAAAVPAGWHTIQLQYTPHQDDLLHAALRHLLAPLPASERGPLEDAIISSSSAQNLRRVAALLARQPQPVVLALHDVYEAPEWLSHMLGLLMNLRVPLMLIASPTTSNTLHGASLAHLDWTRVHQLTLPPLSSGGVYASLRARHPYAEVQGLQARATLVAQLSEGWAPYVDALLDAPELTPRLPHDLSTRIRAQYGHLEPGVRHRLCVLAQVQTQFTPSLACGLLGEDAAGTVNAGLALGILSHAAPHDHVRFPSLECTHDDADARMVFRSEVVRVALAGALPPAERQGVRQTLATLLLHTHPGMALVYARRVQDDALIAQAHAALPAMRAVTWQAARPRPTLASRSPERPGEGREFWTPNGYRLSAHGGGLDVLRRGASAPPPTLHVALGRVTPGTWFLTLRVDVFRASEQVPVGIPPYVVGLQVGDGPLEAYAPHATATATMTSAPATYLSGLPLGEDVQLSGRWDGPPGLLTLSFRAVDVACSVHALGWNGVNLLADNPGNAVLGMGGAAAH